MFHRHFIFSVSDYEIFISDAVLGSASGFITVIFIAYRLSRLERSLHCENGHVGNHKTLVERSQ
jgi:hypothetical protein